MAINELIARGIAPIGRDLPEVQNILAQRQADQQRNALLATQQRMQQDRIALDQQQFKAQQLSAEQQMKIRQKYSEVAGLLNAPTEAKAAYIAQQMQTEPEFARTPFAQMTPDQAIPAMFDGLSAALGQKVEQRQAPVPFEQTPEYRLEQFKQQGRERQARLEAGLRPKDGEGGGLGKPPPGYRWNPDGSLAAIPGGPADIKASADAQKAAKRAENAAVAADMVVSEIDDALSLVGRPTAGTGSGTAKKLGYEPAVNLAAKLETIKANLGFDRLQQMREASPTGGALGAVAVQELTALQSTVASLDQAQSPDQLKKALNKVKYHYGRWSDVMRRAGNDTSGYLDKKAPSVPDDIAAILKKY